MLKQVLKTGMFMTMTCVIALNADAQSRMDKPAERIQMDSKAHPVKMISTIESAIDQKQNAPKSGRSVSEGFEYGFLPTCWTSIDADGDGNDWFHYDFEGTAYEGNYSAASASYFGVALTPDNYLVSPQLLIGADEVLTYQVAAQDPAWPAENYGIFVSTTGNQEADFTDELLVEILEDGDWHFREIDMSAYEGQEVYIAFRHFGVSDQFYMKIDDIVLPGEFTDVECVNVCAEVEFPTVGSEEVTCMEGEDDVWYYFVEFTDGGNETFSFTNSANAIEETIEGPGTITAGPFDNDTEVTFTIAPVEAPECTVTATMVGDCTPPPVLVDGAVSFEGGTTLPVCWTPVDQDGDTFGWSVRESELAFDGDYLIASDSYDSNEGALNPDNYLITSQLTLGEGDSLYYVVGAFSALFYAENYSVLISTTGNEIADFTDVVFTEALNTNEWQGRNIDLSAYDNQDIYIAFRHHDVSDEWTLFLDAIALPGEITDEACIDYCADLEYPTISGTEITCSEGIEGWFYVLELSDTGNSSFNLTNSANEDVVLIEESGVLSFGPFENGVEVTFTFNSIEFVNCTSSITTSGDCTEPCDSFVSGPWTDFVTTGIPVPDGNGVCDVVTIEAFEIWMSEAYALTGLPANVTYVFSACDGGATGSWPITYTVYNPEGEIVAFGTEVDGCSITWLTETEGDYIIAINRPGYCGVAASIDNGFPTLTCSGTVGTIEKVTVDAVIYPNPATQDINVLTPLQGDAEIRIFDAVGRLVKLSNLHLNGSLFTQDLSTLVNGIYTMQITTDNGVAVTRFVKQ